MSTATSGTKPKKLEGNPDANLSGIGNYTFVKTVGEGNFAKVKLAKHKVTGQEVAVKIIDKTSLDEKKLTKLYREVRIMKMLHHPNIVRLYEVIETKHTIYLVMEYVSGGELYDYLVVHGRMKEKEARAKFRQIISAVSYCHKKRVIHRDLKAENLLLDHNLNVKIADFGFSNQYDPDGKLDTFCGSPPYAAPELFQGKRYTGPEVDVWSLGVILYVLATGCLPFDGKNLQEMRESVCRGKYRIPFYLSENCEKLLRKFLVRDPFKRPDLDILVDDQWMNEGYEDSPVSKPVAEELVREDPYIMQVMETKFGIDKDTVIKGLRENVYDDNMAIYFLLWSEKERNGDASITKIGDQMGKSGATIPASPMSPEAPRLPLGLVPSTQTPVSATPPIAAIKEEEGSKEEINVAAPSIAQKDIIGEATPLAIPRVSPRPVVQRTVRRMTVSGQSELKKVVDESKDEAENLRKLKDLQLKNLDEKPAVVEVPAEEAPLPAVIPRPEGFGVKLRPISLATPETQGQAQKKDAYGETAHAVTAVNDDAHKRVNTITGMLKMRSRVADETQSASASPAPVARNADEQPKMLNDDESQFSISIGGDGKPRSLRFTFNSNTTSSKQPDDMIREIVDACTKHDITTRLVSRYLIECVSPPATTLPNAEAVKIEIEVCKLPRLKNLHGLRFKRTSGSSNDYKTVSEKILAAVQL